MNDFKLQYPIVTYDNKLLFDAGTVLSPKMIQTLISDCKDTFPVASLLGHRTVKEDLLSFFRQPPYHVIFGELKKRAELMELMEMINLPFPILESLYYFRKNDYYTYRHLLMVFALSTLLAKHLISDFDVLVQEVIAGPTHDIGKVCIPLDTLKKKVALTKSERHALEHHTLAGYVLLCYYFKDTKNIAARVARDHHERKDGSGYPNGVNIDDSLVDIIMVSDIYDALISPRPYRPVSYDNRTAIEEITWMAKDGKVNMQTVQALVAVNREDAPHYKKCVVSEEKRGVPPEDNVYRIFDDEDSGE